MTDGIGGMATRGGGDFGRPVERASAPSTVDARKSARNAAQVADAVRQQQRAADAAVDPIALGEARERIATMLAQASPSGDGLSAALEGMVQAVPIPLAPGADQDAVAAAQALAQLIAANARPAITVQARLAPAAVQAVLGSSAQ